MDEVQSFSPLSLQIYVYYNRISLFLYFYFHFFSSDTLRIHYLFIYQTIFIVFALHSLCFCNVSNLLLQKNCLYNSVYIIIIILLFLLRIYNVINSGQVKVLTFGLSTIFAASQNILPDINSIMRPFSISSAVSGLSLPTPANVLGIKKGAGASK